MRTEFSDQHTIHTSLHAMRTESAAVESLGSEYDISEAAHAKSVLVHFNGSAFHISTRVFHACRQLWTSILQTSSNPINKTTSLLQDGNAVQMDSASKLGSTIATVLICLLLNWVVDVFFQVKVSDDPHGSDTVEDPQGEQQASSEQEPGNSDAQKLTDEYGPSNKKLPSNPLLYMMVGRVKDKTDLVSRSLVDQALTREMEIASKKLLVASKEKLTPGVQDKLSSSSFRMYYSLEKKAEFLVCLAVPDSKYPEHHAYKCMNDLLACVKKYPNAWTCEKGDLNEPMEMKLDELLSKYENPWTKTTYGKMLGKTAEVQEHLNENLQTVQEAGVNMDNLEKRSAGMSSAAQSFQSNAATAKWKHQVEQYKFYAKACIMVSGTVTVLAIWSVL